MDFQGRAKAPPQLKLGGGSLAAGSFLRASLTTPCWWACQTSRAPRSQISTKFTQLNPLRSRLLEGFLNAAQQDAQYVFESHPMQSTVRVLVQLDAPETMIVKFWSDLQDRLKLAKP